MFETLKSINKKPKAFEIYSAPALWNDPHRSEQMLCYHLNENVDLSSRNRPFIETSVEWIDRRFQLGEALRVCDFGCGPGLYTTRFARKGAQVTGIDFSKRSIEYAREVAQKEQLEIDYHVQNYLDYQSDKSFDLITMIMCDFCALSPLQRDQLLNVFSSQLAKGGKILFDVYSLDAYEDRKEGALYEHQQLYGFWSSNDYYAFLNTFKYEEEKVVLDKYTIFEENCSYEVYNWLQYYNLDVLRLTLEKAGFNIIETYANVAGEAYKGRSPEIAVIAEKMS